MKVLLTGGGTAGHVNPALAIAAALTEYDPKTELLFAASALTTDKAGDLIPRAGYELRRIHICGMRRPIFLPSNLKLPFIMLRSRKEAKALIEEFKPDLIVGTGGYACWPVVSVGASMKIPTAVHESNAVLGKAIEQVRKKVDIIMVNFPEMAERLKKKGLPAVHVGNPYMKGFGKITRAEARAALGLSDDTVYVLSFGGSLGADRVNEGVVSVWEALGKDYPNARFCHAAGKRDYDRTKAMAEEKGLLSDPRFELMDYIYDMPLRMAAADIVVSRAGAMSISELALMKKAAVLIPSPNVTDNHQYKNAMALHNEGASICVEEKELAGGALIQAVRALLDDSAKRHAMEKAIYEGFAVPEANEVIVNELMKIVKK